MRLILNGINGHYLRDITNNHINQTEEVIAAVAYATNDLLLFDWCWKNKIPLSFYGRLDDSVAVKTAILEKFLARQSLGFTCRLVQHHHAKVIRWRGVGVYIGSANLTDKAWNKNVEAGCFFTEDEITADMDYDINKLFSKLHEKSTPLSKELLELMKKRQKTVDQSQPPSTEFWESSCIKKWEGLVYTAPMNSLEKSRQAFLEEWYSTLQDIRDIGARVSQSSNRPSWVGENIPLGAQADQFLHAHYYQRTFDGKTAKYAELFEKNKDHKELALAGAIEWWSKLPEAPSSEDISLNIKAPFLRNALSESNINSLEYETFREVCASIHAVVEFAKRVKNSIINLPDIGERYTVEQKIDALSKKIWDSVSIGKYTIVDVIRFVLYGGPQEKLPERIWLAVNDREWKIECVGISSLGELVGWALPDTFPPRNGRTSKALRSLGYDVTIHTS